MNYRNRVRPGGIPGDVGGVSAEVGGCSTHEGPREIGGGKPGSCVAVGKAGADFVFARNGSRSRRSSHDFYENPVKIVAKTAGAGRCRPDGVGPGGQVEGDVRRVCCRRRRPNNRASAVGHLPVGGHQRTGDGVAALVAAAGAGAHLDGASGVKARHDVHVQGVLAGAAEVAVVELDDDPLRVAEVGAAEPVDGDALRALAAGDVAAAEHRPVDASSLIIRDVVLLGAALADLVRPLNLHIVGDDGDGHDVGQAANRSGAATDGQRDGSLRTSKPFHGDEIVGWAAAVEDVVAARERPGVCAAVGVGAVGDRFAFANGANAVDFRYIGCDDVHLDEAGVGAVTFISGYQRDDVSARGAEGVVRLKLGGGGKVPEIPDVARGIEAVVLKIDGLPLANGDGAVGLRWW